MSARNLACLAMVITPLAQPAQAMAQSARRAECAGVRWTPPRTLRVGANAFFLEAPAIVPLHGRALLLGPRAFVMDSLGNPVNPLLPPGAHYIDAVDHIPMGVQSNGHGQWDWVSMPPRALALPWMPRAVVDGGVVHVIWASSDKAVDDIPPTVPSIWYARFDGSHWTQPSRVATGHRYYWSSANTSALVTRGGTLHLVVSTVNEGLTYLHATDGRWTEQHVGISSLYYGYPNIAVLPSGRLVIVAQGLSKRGRPEGSSESGVFATRSDDGGASWSTPRLVSTANAEPAYDHHLLLDARGRLLIVWYQQTDSSGRPAERVALGNSPGRVQIAASTDGGASWRQLAPSALLPNADGLTVMQMDDGRLLVALADRVDEQIIITTWNDGWHPFAGIPASPGPFHPILGRGDAQRPVLTWGARRSHEWVTTVMTTLTPCS